jgi:hypothetical protein
VTYLPCWSATYDSHQWNPERVEEREGFPGSWSLYCRIAYQALEPVQGGQDIDSVKKRIPKTTDTRLVDLGPWYRAATSKAMQKIIGTSYAGRVTNYGFVVPILAAIEDEPIEDGMTHPAEHLLERVLAVRCEDVIMWLRSLLWQGGNAEVAVTVLKCINRVKQDDTPDWGYDLAREALEHEDVEVRDSAIQLFESWGGPEAMEALSNHKEEEPWLAEYVRTVIADLSS